ncbi:glycosyltransferase family 2 protein [Oerskovia paurometabola]|uniref:Glycosyltransferase family 2 protein n=1 Tax=Oerskovia paurometabola TaxID=162170 RepID=A0ABW1X7X9_9CELL|nr:glycosyltransferase family 2 protein [Oerskovia paurometabola]MBM7498344.1 N-acetylglucosaminyl-diphospho-decaprenol L-rhamnosyltransferase [Oerskovia paurometabola]
MSSPAGAPNALRVICVVYNPGTELVDFATSLRTATTRTTELVLVNNGGPSDIARRLAQEEGTRLVESGGNLGYGRAANLGARGAGGDWVVVANPDLVWAPGSLDVLLEAGTRHEEAGSLGPRILNTDGTEYPSARAIPSLRLGAGHAVLGKVWPSNPWSTAYRSANTSRSDTERAAGWLSGACLLLRREAFEQVGGFDEGYFMFFEDLDLGDRLGQAGWANVFVPAAVVTHVQGVSWKKDPAPMIRAHHVSARRYLTGRYGAWYQAPLRWLLSLGLAARERIEIRTARRG